MTLNERNLVSLHAHHSSKSVSIGFLNKHRFVNFCTTIRWHRPGPRKDTYIGARSSLTDISTSVLSLDLVEQPVGDTTVKDGFAVFV